ncbi:uncharacterized protein LOC142219666 [Haematobia irritans]|uniref:uncharacterized protein LOC142219666 n=1 Tax=Haematobia irritans TaxID=7368 RepID=UPI003F4F4B41
MFNKILIIVALASLGYVQATDPNLKAVEVDPKVLTNVTLLKTDEGRLGNTEYTFRCTAGTTKTARVTCSGHDRTTWTTPHNVELTLNCPPNGQGPIIAFADIYFTVTTTNVNCYITAGGIGYSYIQMKVIANGTELFDYSDNFYNY